VKTVFRDSKNQFYINILFDEKYYLLQR